MHDSRSLATWWTAVALAHSCPVGMIIERSTRSLSEPTKNTIMLVFVGVSVVLWIVAGVMWWRVWAGAGPRVGPPLTSPRPPRQVKCPACAYSLEGLKDLSHCPECGNEVPWGEIRDLRQDGSRKETLP